jgi:hypothetical protein
MPAEEFKDSAHMVSQGSLQETVDAITSSLNTISVAEKGRSDCQGSNNMRQYTLSLTGPQPTSNGSAPPIIGLSQQFKQSHASHPSEFNTPSPYMDQNYNLAIGSAGLTNSSSQAQPGMHVGLNASSALTPNYYHTASPPSNHYKRRTDSSSPIQAYQPRRYPQSRHLPNRIRSIRHHFRISKHQFLIINRFSLSLPDNRKYLISHHCYFNVRSVHHQLIQASPTGISCRSRQVQRRKWHNQLYLSNTQYPLFSQHLGEDHQHK